MNEPVLSICVPSRNRQVYFMQTIASLLAARRDDVEFVFVDNSDDPTILDDFMRPLAGDPRIRYLRTGSSTLSMMDNWERALNAATGRYVAFIGDDDYIDPGLAAFIANLERQVSADAIAWTGPNYVWPTAGSRPQSLSISLGTDITQFSKSLLMSKAFLWEGCSHVPLCGFSIYHGAFSRRLLDRIRAMGKGRYFENPNIDWEMAFKAILIGKMFIHCSRPFSILGVCPLSNSAAIGKLATEREALARFSRELGRDIDSEPWLATTPFRNAHGITAIIYLVQHWLSQKIGFEQRGYEKNLVQAFSANCSLFSDLESFDIVAERYRTALRQWHDGRYLSCFEPQFSPAATPQGSMTGAFAGVRDEKTLVFRDDIAGATNPGELFQILAGTLERPGDIEIKLGKADAAAEGPGKAAA